MQYIQIYHKKVPQIRKSHPLYHIWCLDAQSLQLTYLTFSLYSF